MDSGWHDWRVNAQPGRRRGAQETAGVGDQIGHGRRQRSRRRGGQPVQRADPFCDRILTQGRRCRLGPRPQLRGQLLMLLRVDSPTAPRVLASCEDYGRLGDPLRPARVIPQERRNPTRIRPWFGRAGGALNGSFCVLAASCLRSPLCSASDERSRLERWSVWPPASRICRGGAKWSPMADGVMSHMHDGVSSEPRKSFTGPILMVAGIASRGS